jgi:hypothetical protein
MSPRKLMAGFAALTTAGAIAIPAASASARTTPTHYTAPKSLCMKLQSQSNAALATGHSTLAPLLVDTAGYIGCRRAVR